MKLTTTIEFEKVEVSVIMYESEKIVTIDFGDEEYDFTFEEYYKFVTILEKFKPTKTIKAVKI